MHQKSTLSFSGYIHQKMFSFLSSFNTFVRLFLLPFIVQQSTVTPHFKNDFILPGVLFFGNLYFRAIGLPEY